MQAVSGVAGEMLPTKMCRQIWKYVTIYSHITSEVKPYFGRNWAEKPHSRRGWSEVQTAFILELRLPTCGIKKGAKVMFQPSLLCVWFLFRVFYKDPAGIPYASSTWPVSTMSIASHGHISTHFLHPMQS